MTARSLLLLRAPHKCFIETSMTRSAAGAATLHSKSDAGRGHGTRVLSCVAAALLLLLQCHYIRINLFMIAVSGA